jgi:histidinol-phosphate aminotransferase
MPVTRRGFVKTVGGGAVGLWSASVLAARGAEAWQATGGQAPAPAAAPLVRLDSNENPLGPGPRTLEAIRAAVARDSSLYPHRAGDALPDAIARFHRLAPDQVLAACGSGEILRIAVQAFTSPAAPLVTAAPTFETCTRTAQFLKHGLVEVPLDERLALNLAAMEERAAGAGLVFLCNPNNPTGPVHGSARVADFITRVIKRSPTTTILVDEAYHEYVDDPGYATAAPLALQHPQVIVSRTFSKIYGLAGLRIGYAIGQPATLRRMAGWRVGNGLNLLGIRAAAAALGDTAHVEAGRAANRKVRELLRRSFVDLGYRVAESEANFILADIKRDAEAFGKECRAKGIAVGRPFPPLLTWTRVTIGTEDEIRQAMEVFRNVLTRAVSVSVS